MFRCFRSLVFAGAVCLAATTYVVASNGQSLANEPNLTPEQRKEFLLHAKVVDSKQINKGITSPWRLTLSDGQLTHDAGFQSVEFRKERMRLPSGKDELNFRDSYVYNIAAYELARLLGLDHMVPATVERKWRGQRGALSWWIPAKWDENARRQQNVHPPDPEAWSKQMYKVRVFTQLICDTDRNLGNILITEDWKVWMIDFTRSFRQYHDLQNPKDLVQCDRQLLEKLRQLDANTLLERTRPHLTKSEVKAVMARRDKIVEHFQRLIAEKGEGAVLY